MFKRNKNNGRKTTKVASVEEKPTPKEPVEEIPVPTLQSMDDDFALSYVINKEGDYDIDFRWKKQDEETALKIGYMLAGLHAGIFKQKTLEILLDITSNQDSKEFGDMIMSQWILYEEKFNLVKSKLSAQYKTIRPSDVFKQLKGGR